MLYSRLKNKLRTVRNSFLRTPVDPSFDGKKSFSQSGEDLIIEYLFGLRKIQTPQYLDIGGYDPIVSNNTYKFYLKGARGVNIDANPTAIEKFRKVRPEDKNLNIGVGPEKGDFDFYLMEDESLNTFSAQEKDSLESLGHKLNRTFKIEVETVNEVLKKYFNGKEIDLISIDAEGIDFDIVKSFDFNKFGPKVICIESVNYSVDGTGAKRYDLCAFIENAGYIEYANTNINSIFVNKAWWFKSANL